MTPSKLRYTVEPPTPLDETPPPIHDYGNGLSRAGTTPEINGRHSRHASLTGKPVSGSDDDDDHADRETGVGKTVKGLLGKLRTKVRHDNASSDEVSRLSCVTFGGR